MLLVSSIVNAQTLPAGYIGRVLNNTPGAWQTYSFTFTPGSTGANYFMLAFRQDPAYWRVDNLRVTAAGSTVNMLTNGDMTTGGGIQVQTSGGTQYINAPTAWGVAYQNGTYPAAAGTWTGGMWYDGAVGSFDSIYQAVRLTAGVTYTFAFDVNGDNTSDGNSVQLGVYAGTCGNVALAPTECTLPSSSGFTQIATPSQTYTAGCTTNCPTNPDAGPSYSSDITAAQTTTLNAARSRLGGVASGNRIDLYSDGSGNTVTVEQVGPYNKIQGLGGGNAHVAGFGTAVNIKQGDSASGKNLIELYVQGNGNNITMSQARNTTTGATDSVESGGHVASLSVTGDVNTMVLRQGNDGGLNSGHYANVVVQGNQNNGTIKQSSDGEKRAFISVTGSQDAFTILQNGTGAHYLDLTLSGNGNSANITQTGTAGHKATVNLVNAGGPSSLTLVQQGTTAQVYSITQQCATLSGCSVSVTQGGGP